MFKRLFERISGRQEAEDKHDDHSEMMENIADFETTTAGDVLVHRRNVVALDALSSRDDVLRQMLEGRFTRYPVYEDNIDNIVAIVHAKDVFRETIAPDGTLKGDFTLSKLFKEPFFVPITKKIDALFEEMRRRKIHIAVVVDEYGGTAGIVTMEDLIEEIMGEIFDEYDVDEKPLVVAVNEEQRRVDGQMPLDEFAEYFSVAMPEDDYDTVGGFVIGLLGRIPEPHETPSIEWNGLLLSVSEIEDNRIVSITVSDVADNAEE